MSATLERAEPSREQSDQVDPEWAEFVFGSDCTIQTAADNRSQVTAALESASALRLRLDRVQEFDTAGLQVLLVLRQEAAAAEKPLIFFEPSGVVREVLALAGLDLELNFITADRSSPQS